ncbi:glutathione s-transferase like [Lecanosticta acicola]|uniref:Glutathione s-transferase like n=1 Tax=Lecanosticta acicola TaxID=111012 RepID=A0AAI8Z0M4_9PEZI|nr:glutathione s-transferase like [Lecanosticta acicola]
MDKNNYTNEAPPNGIILFWYHASPYGRRVKWYLTLRKIAHAECIQPPMLPRPDLAALGVTYRRSPVMSIGRDIYYDTRLIIAKLEERFPSSDQHPGLSSRETVGMAALLQKWVVENMFREAVKCIPQDFALLKDPTFQKDRAGFFGPGWRVDASSYSEGLVNMRHFFGTAESLFADGRQWVAGTKEVSLADLEGIWVFDWFLNDLRPKPEYFGEDRYPKVHEWRSRFRQALATAREQAPQTVSLKGPDAVSLVTQAAFSDQDLVVDSTDPMRLQDGAMVELFPTDGGGFTHQDRGRLVKLSPDEVALAVQSAGGEEMHVHAPRWQFRIRAIDGARL